MIFIAYIILLVAFIYFPFGLKVVVFLINSVIPDPIPYLDETVMVLNMAIKAKGVNKFLKS